MKKTLGAILSKQVHSANSSIVIILNMNHFLSINFGSRLRLLSSFLYIRLKAETCSDNFFFFRPANDVFYSLLSWKNYILTFKWIPMNHVFEGTLKILLTKNNRYPLSKRYPKKTLLEVFFFQWIKDKFPAKKQTVIFTVVFFNRFI